MGDGQKEAPHQVVIAQEELVAAPIQHNASRQEEYCSHTEQMLSFKAERIEQMSEATEQCEALQRRMAAAGLLAHLWLWATSSSATSEDFLTSEDPYIAE